MTNPKKTPNLDTLAVYLKKQEQDLNDLQKVGSKVINEIVGDDDLNEPLDQPDPLNHPVIQQAVSNNNQLRSYSNFCVNFCDEIGDPIDPNQLDISSGSLQERFFLHHLDLKNLVQANFQETRWLYRLCRFSTMHLTSLVGTLPLQVQSEILKVGRLTPAEYLAAEQMLISAIKVLVSNTLSELDGIGGGPDVEKRARTALQICQQLQSARFYSYHGRLLRFIDLLILIGQTTEPMAGDEEQGQEQPATGGNDQGQATDPDISSPAEAAYFQPLVEAVKSFFCLLDSFSWLISLLPLPFGSLIGFVLTFIPVITFVLQIRRLVNLCRFLIRVLKGVKGDS